VLRDAAAAKFADTATGGAKAVVGWVFTVHEIAAIIGWVGPALAVATLVGARY